MPDERGIHTISSILYGALAYFALPLDVIPDVTPIAGYTDDMGILAGALLASQAYASDEIHAEATAKAARLFS